MCFINMYCIAYDTTVIKCNRRLITAKGELIEGIPKGPPYLTKSPYNFIYKFHSFVLFLIKWSNW